VWLVDCCHHWSGPNKKPWICPLSFGGAIDPSGYYDPRSNSRWVVYKVDGNSIGHGGVCGNTMPPIVSTPIMLQQVSLTDGRTLVGKSYQLITNGLLDGPVVEAPSLTNLDGKYILFFSSNCFATILYDVSYATADALTGPWKKYGPFFVTGTDGLVAPGGVDDRDQWESCHFPWVSETLRLIFLVCRPAGVDRRLHCGGDGRREGRGETSTC